MSRFSSIARMATQKATQFVKQNPDKIEKVADKAAQFANKRTNGKYASKIEDARRKLGSVTGENDRRNPNDPNDPRNPGGPASGGVGSW